jgi:hypothetical protein
MKCHLLHTSSLPQVLSTSNRQACSPGPFSCLLCRDDHIRQLFLGLTPIQSYPIQSKSIQSNLSLPKLIPLKDHWLTSYPYCSIKHLPNGMHTIHARCIFENMKYANMQICKYDRRKRKRCKDAKMQR